MMGFPMTKSSVVVKYLSTCHPHRRDGLLKGDIKNLPEGETLFHNSPQTYYENRPENYDEFEGLEEEDWDTLSLSEFWCKYDIVYEGKRNDFKSENLKPLLNEKGWIKKRTFDAVLRYYLNYENLEDFCRGLLILFLPFRNEMSEIHQKDVKTLVLENWKDIQKRREHFEAYKVMTDMINDIQKLQEKEDNKLGEDEEEEETNESPIETTSEADLQDFDKWAKEQAKKSLKNMAQFISLESPLAFRQKISELNNQQRKLFDDIMERETSPDIDKQPYFVYVAGAAGTGKSHLLRILLEGVKQVNIKAGNELEKPSILAMAPTANAAYILGAKTIESALNLSGNNYSYQKLSGNREANLKFLYDDVSTIFCDEVSMVGSGKLTKINFRMQDLADKNQKTDFMGRKNFIAGGDMWQLPPVKDRFVYEKNKLDGRPSCAPSHWTENFTIYYLTEKMRSQNDPEFGEICDGIARGNLKAEQTEYLQKLVRPCPSINDNENFKSGRTTIIATTNEITTRSQYLRSKGPHKCAP